MKNKSLLPCQRGTEQAQSKSSWSYSMKLLFILRRILRQTFQLVVCAYSQSAFYKVLKAMCSHMQPSYGHVKLYQAGQPNDNNAFQYQYFSGQVMNSNIGLEVYSQQLERSCGRGDGEPLEFRNDFLIPDYFQLNFRLRR